MPLSVRVAQMSGWLGTPPVPPRRPRTWPGLNGLPPSPCCGCGHPEPPHLGRGRKRW